MTVEEQAIADAKAKEEAEAKVKAEAEAKALRDKKPEYTEEQKAEYHLKKAADEAKKLGLDTAKVLGIQPKISIDENLSDDTPLTVGTLKNLQKKESQENAIQLADAIEDVKEREEVKDLLKTRFIPSGDAEKDLELARLAINSKRNQQLAEELNRKGNPKRTAGGGSGDGKPTEEFEPDANEKVFMAHPYNLSKEDILKAREKSQAKKS